jgi:ubiquinone/menaquinone biosynthesis C-methylase UbiE
MKNNIDWDEVNKVVNTQIYSGLSGKLLQLTHKQLAAFGNKFQTQHDNVLEIGAGQGEHFPFVNTNFAKYTMSDISDWGAPDISKILETDNRATFEIQDIQALTYPDSSFDRVITTCVIAHVDEPYESFLEVRRVTKNEGTCSFLVSADPSILLRFIRAMLTAPKMKKLSSPYLLINAISHRNSANGIIEIAKHVFRDDQVQIKYLPFRIRSWNLSTHIIINVKIRK